MTARQWIYHRLTSYGPLRDVIGDRVYPGFKADLTPRPYVTVFRVSNGKVRSLAGDSGTKHPRFQLDIWADSQESADEVDELVHAALNDYHADTDDITIQWAWVDDARDGFDEPIDGGEVPLFRVSLDLMVWHNN